MERDDKIRYAVERTELIRPPKQNLATFGATTIRYYLITEQRGSMLSGKGMYLLNAPGLLPLLTWLMWKASVSKLGSTYE